MARLRLATVWLGGCSGCHMSFLDLDEFLIDLADRADIVYSPVIDAKQYPDGVDVVLIEGAVATEEQVEHVRTIRERTKFVISFGDCAVTANVPGMRNPIGPGPLLERAYVENVTENPGVPDRVVPRLLARAAPVHTVVGVDVFLPGCPPPADLIYETLLRLLGEAAPGGDHRPRFG
jgi:NAD-reducing hydrogenase small subunit